MTLPRPPFPNLIDSSMRADFVACPQKFFLSYLYDTTGLRASEISIDLHFGSCFSLALEDLRRNFYDRGLDPATSLFEAQKHALRVWGDKPNSWGGSKKSLETLVLALDSYCRQYPLGQEEYVPFRLPGGKLALETTFAIPIPEVQHPETGEPIIYAGRFDMLATSVHAPSLIFIDDEKTASRLGETWGKQWHMRSQFTGYVWAMEQYGYQIGGVIVRGIAILSKDITHALVIEQRSQFQVNQWLFQLQRDVTRMIECWKSNYWDLALDDACSSYSGCQFMPVCMSSSPDFTRYFPRNWSPLSIKERLTP